ncbi:hypothetical protein BCR42DRAFT_324518 [Absidia repens]|uniref:RRM domain-containing protein n=1 Tax=Absidia repens TaxID=90262 RepID=A0A1X2IL66_9FUNG|nr:hypothetical protein BCR42DRAFT_324518 [Absidia repens]
MNDSREAVLASVQAMESELAKLQVMQSEAERSMLETKEDKEVVDSRSVFVGQVDYAASPEDLQTHFQSCGNINRITIPCDKYTGFPKGYAYIEFADSSCISNALALDGSLFRGRSLKVTTKRTNIPGFTSRRIHLGRGQYYFPSPYYAPFLYYGHSPSYGYHAR